ncbi:MAG: OmpA family protein [Cocleimonas sp.]
MQTPTILKSLFVSSIVLMTNQPNYAEQFPNFAGQTPIAWGDCIPVPVMPAPFPQNGMPSFNNIPMGTMGGTPPPPPLMPFSLPPPSPFFNAAPSPQIPMPVAAQAVCDNSELQALQARYNQGASASKKRIDEITQALNDSNNQMADARAMIDSFSKKTNKEKSTLNSSVSMLEMQLTNLRNTNKSLQAKLSAAEASGVAQTRKINALDRSSSQLAALQSAFKARNDENVQFKKQIAQMDGAHKSLLADMTLSNERSKDAAQAKSKLTSDASMLDMQLTNIKNKNKSLQAKLSVAESNASTQTRKINALERSAGQATALKGAYNARSNENAALKKKIASLEALKQTSDSYQAEVSSLGMKLTNTDNKRKSLLGKIATLEATASDQARKVNALTATNSKMSSFKRAYKTLNDQNAQLKNHVVKLDSAYKTLKSKMSKAQSDAGSQARKINALSQSATELTAIQSAYKERVNDNIILKAQLAELSSLKKSSALCHSEVSNLGMRLTNTDNKRKSLLGKIATLETTSSNQARKITALMAASTELEGLKSAYKDLSSTKVELTSKLTDATTDSDNDGIVDSKDNCPTSPAGASVNAEGCPAVVVDTDGDSVADANDLCPATKTGATVNEFGCEPTQNITLKGVVFNTGSAQLKKRSLPVILAAANTLKNNLKLKVEIAGYTDYQGSGAVNKRLSQRRANTVMIQLIKNGVDASRLTAKGYGEENPVANNRTAQGRATNRRVELKIRK